MDESLCSISMAGRNKHRKRKVNSLRFRTLTVFLGNDSNIAQEVDVLTVLLVQRELSQQLREVLRNAEVLEMVHDALLDRIVPLVVGRSGVAILTHLKVRAIALHAHGGIHMKHLKRLIRRRVALEVMWRENPYHKDHLEVDAVTLLRLAALRLAINTLTAVRAHVLEHLELQLGIVGVLLHRE